MQTEQIPVLKADEYPGGIWYYAVSYTHLAAGAYARQLCIIVQVHMAVHEPLRLVFIHQIIEARKALVSTIRAVEMCIRDRCKRGQDLYRHRAAHGQAGHRCTGHFYLHQQLERLLHAVDHLSLIHIFAPGESS